MSFFYVFLILKCEINVYRFFVNVNKKIPIVKLIWGIMNSSKFRLELG